MDFKYYFIALALLVFSSCSNSSSGGDSTVVRATSAEAESIIQSAESFSEIKSFSDYVETKSADPDLSAAQQDKLDNCVQSSSTSGTSSQSTTQVTISGAGCPISYSLNASGSQSGNQFSATASITYRVIDSEFAQLAEIQSAQCNLSFSGSRISTEELDMTASVSCQLNTKSHGVVSISLNLEMNNTATSKMADLSMNIIASGKILNVSVNSSTIDGVTTSRISINGQATDKNINLSGLTGLFNM